MATPAPNAPDPGARREMTHVGRNISIQEDATHCEVAIDGIPVGVLRLGPGSYHSHILTHQEYSSAEALAKALAETEGKLWRLPPPGRPPQGHDHGGKS